METSENKNRLIHAIMNQVESDFQADEVNAFDLLLDKLLISDYNIQLFHEYLSDSAKDNLHEGNTFIRKI